MIATRPPTFSMSSSQAGSSSRPLRKASVACGACKNRKTKCTGESPCSACSSRGTPCAYDVAADQRRKIANQRNIQHLAETRLEVEKLSTLVAGIVAIIRADGGTSIPDLVSTIQSGMDLSQLSAHVRNTRRTVPRVEHAYQQIDKTIEEDGLPSPSELLSNVPFNLDPSLVGGSESSSTQQRVESPVNPRKRRHRSGRITDIVNPPIFVPAKPWTTVTDDDDFVSHLISLWFTWAHPWWHWVDEQAFMEAMHSGDLENPNCSPYLVNMILADSCLLDAFDEDGGLSNSELRHQFYQAAIKDLNIEKQKPATISVIQTLGVQWTYLVTNGQDKEGHEVLHEQHARLPEMYQWRQRLENRYLPNYIDRVDRCLHRLTWTTFALDTVSSMSSGVICPPSIPNHVRPVPRVTHNDGTHADSSTVEWSPYPEQKPLKAPFHPECHYSAFLSLAEVTSLDEAMLPQGHPDTDDQIHDSFYGQFNKLENWASTLPDCMQLGPQSTPHVMALHAVHHWCILSMSKEAAAAEAGHPRKSNIMGTEGIWQDRSMDAARAVGQLMIRMYQEWGNDHFPVIITQPVSLSLFALLDQLHSEENRQAFIGLCYCMHAAARRFVVGKGIMRLLQNTAWEKGIALPVEVQSLFISEHISAVQPQSVGEPKEITVDYLLGKWDDFDLR